MKALLILVFWTSNGGVATVQLDMASMAKCKEAVLWIWAERENASVYRTAYCVDKR